MKLPPTLARPITIAAWAAVAYAWILLASWALPRVHWPVVASYSWAVFGLVSLFLCVIAAGLSIQGWGTWLGKRQYRRIIEAALQIAAAIWFFGHCVRAAWRLLNI